MDILVDLDGTLVDPKPGLIGSVQYALRKLGHPVPPAEELLWLIGPPFRVSFPKLLGRVRPHRGGHRPLSRELLATAPCTTPSSTTAWPMRSIALRAAGCRLFVATSKPHYYARPILEHFDLARAFARHPWPRARRHQRPQGRPHRPYRRPRRRAARDSDHDRRPRVRRDGGGPQRHPRRRRHLGLRQPHGACKARRGPCHSLRAAVSTADALLS